MFVSYLLFNVRLLKSLEHISPNICNIFQFPSEFDDKKRGMNKNKFHSFPVIGFCTELLFSFRMNSAHRTNACASAAINANVRIDVINIAF